jgi:hypothetical protein
MTYTIIDCREGAGGNTLATPARSPEHAAKVALGLDLFRSGVRNHMVCRVYWEQDGQRNMVRLYSQSRHPVA